MKKVTIKELENHINELNERIKRCLEHETWQTKEIVLLRDLAKSLENDKQWLKSIHSSMLQATAEMFRNR